MQGSDAGYLIYLVLLGALILSSWLVTMRSDLNRTLQQAAIWALIFAGAVLVYAAWPTFDPQLFPRRAISVEDGVIELARAPDGHFRADITVNGEQIEFIVDTGASLIVLSQADAASAGLDPQALDYRGRARTANGVVATAAARVEDFRIGPVQLGPVDVSVNGGPLDISLLGMTALERFGRVEIAGDRMRLHF
ncbi:retropepsin-like aspartic protease family protein [Oceanomicrobium pacificus]|uniref:TIGR02281 family clan AA aspartic protease n=1 Tax=Oceanomicrobium pacificus TaxID=2692916 RepID=A0A6B0TPA2_9RHOB|nr:TIGR02281 family clan AA aspartic protease [Oceanomicrobium pacificus]MXU65716.1 TIGR02281 family clan AA aspartic protease [Oceanomicrobium pacificus]